MGYQIEKPVPFGMAGGAGLMIPQEEITYLTHSYFNKERNWWNTQLGIYAFLEMNAGQKKVRMINMEGGETYLQGLDENCEGSYHTRGGGYTVHEISTCGMKLLEKWCPQEFVKCLETFMNPNTNDIDLEKSFNLIRQKAEQKQRNAVESAIVTTFLGGVDTSAYSKPEGTSDEAFEWAVKQVQVCDGLAAQKNDEACQLALKKFADAVDGCQDDRIILKAASELFESYYCKGESGDLVEFMDNEVEGAPETVFIASTKLYRLLKRAALYLQTNRDAREQCGCTPFDLERIPYGLGAGETKQPSIIRFKDIVIAHEKAFSGWDKRFGVETYALYLTTVGNITFTGANDLYNTSSLGFIQVDSRVETLGLMNPTLVLKPCSISDSNKNWEWSAYMRWGVGLVDKNCIVGGIYQKDALNK